MKQYEVEKSVDGNQFTKSASLTAINMGVASYHWTDQQAPAGYHYYRIRSISKDGQSNYTKVVKVLIGEAVGEITVYPNPVTNGTINLQLTGQPSGRYGVRLLNALGQVILSRIINHIEGGSTESVRCDHHLAKGIFQLEVTKPGGEVKTIKVLN